MSPMWVLGLNPGSSGRAPGFFIFIVLFFQENHVKFFPEVISSCVLFCQYFLQPSGEASLEIHLTSTSEGSFVLLDILSVDYGVLSEFLKLGKGNGKPLF